MDRRFVALKATDSQDAAVEVFRREDRTALPVTDTQGILIGIVTVDDALDVAERRATREMQRVGGSEALDEPYMDIALWRMVKKRAGWLVVLFLGEMLTATAMGFFEHEIARAVVLALFVPLIISSGGNSGSQASTLVIRAMAVGELRLKDWWRVDSARGGVGSDARRASSERSGSCGSASGRCSRPCTARTGRSSPRRSGCRSSRSSCGEHWSDRCCRSSCAGSDSIPATSSAPFVATLVDVTGLVIYFSVGLVVLKGSLL